MPDIVAQRTAMQRLSFLVGRWAGEARQLRGPGEFVELLQTEEARFKLNGLLLEIEGVGLRKSDSQPALQALGIISYDDQKATYQMRAFNDGRFLETELRLLEEGLGLTWGFTLGDIRTKSVLRINERGEWTEVHEISVGSRPETRLMDLTVRKQD
ncbi:MAG TPA: hypothetical protein VJN42_12215 [Candidatus Acidoferrum sp.]|nr:hypothetical protein [Candidatus Acidoferrum sp.]